MLCAHFTHFRDEGKVQISIKNRISENKIVAPDFIEKNRGYKRVK
jgi:hypothetical protein